MLLIVCLLISVFSMLMLIDVLCGFLVMSLGNSVFRCVMLLVVKFVDIVCGLVVLSFCIVFFIGIWLCVLGCWVCLWYWW